MHPALKTLSNLAYRFEFIHRLWSLLPSKCKMRACENNILRWMEGEIEFTTGPNTGKTFPVCYDCGHRLRQAGFKSGARVINHPDGSIEYAPQK